MTSDETYELKAWKEYARALEAVLSLRTRQYRAHCQGTIRDTKFDSEFAEASIRLEKAKEDLP